MAAANLVLFAILLAGVLANPPDVPEDAHKECISQFREQDVCYNHCIQKYLGVLDKDGHYVESRTAEVLRITDTEKRLNQEQVNKIAKACNTLNEQAAAAGCERATQVFKCIDDERFKIIGIRP